MLSLRGIITPVHKTHAAYSTCSFCDFYIFQLHFNISLSLRHIIIVYYAEAAQT